MSISGDDRNREQLRAELDQLRGRVAELETRSSESLAEKDRRVVEMEAVNEKFQREIAEHRQKEEELQYVIQGAHCLLWHSLVEEHEGGFLWHTHGITMEMAQQFLPFAISPGESLDESWYRNIPPEDRESMEEDYATALREGRPGYNHEFRFYGVDGAMHCLYSLHMPNIVYVVNPEGIVTYRCDWMHIGGLKEALDNRDKLHTVEHADSSQLTDRSMVQTFKVMWNGGFIALWDFIKAMPQLPKLHHEVDEYYKEHGQLKR